MDEPLDLLVVRLSQNEGTIDKTFDDITAQIPKMRRLFLLGRVDRMISIKGKDEEGRLTLATWIFLQCFWILPTSC